MATNQNMFSGDDTEWMPPKSGRIDWADEMDRISPEGRPSKPSLPEPQNFIDEAKGIRSEVTYRYNARNQKEKVTRVYRIEKTRVPKGIASRREWIKFGEAVRDKDGVDTATTNESEVIPFRLTTNKDELELGITRSLNEVMKIVEDFPKPEEDKLSAKLPSTDYVPPRHSGLYTESRDRYNFDEPLPAVKISNLSLDTTEQDVKELLISFGRLNRLHMPKDRRNKDSHKGVAFATFPRKEIGEKVILKLNGYAYDHLILKVEWSKSQRSRN